MPSSYLLRLHQWSIDIFLWKINTVCIIWSSHLYNHLFLLSIIHFTFLKKLIHSQSENCGSISAHRYTTISIICCTTATDYDIRWHKILPTNKKMKWWEANLIVITWHVSSLISNFKCNKLKGLRYEKTCSLLKLLRCFTLSHVEDILKTIRYLMKGNDTIIHIFYCDSAASLTALQIETFASLTYWHRSNEYIEWKRMQIECRTTAW